MIYSGIIFQTNATVKKIKSEAQVLFMVYRDKRTPLVAKILFGIIIGYLLCPIDLIPDFIPVLGILDDLIIVPALIALLLSWCRKPIEAGLLTNELAFDDEIIAFLAKKSLKDFKAI